MKADMVQFLNEHKELHSENISLIATGTTEVKPKMPVLK